MRHALILLAVGACGDDLPRPQHLEARSGSRLKLEVHLYEDGSRETETDVFYDTSLHARCTPRTWADGTLRCVPIADSAVFVDDKCEDVIGVGLMMSETKPTHFLGYDWVTDSLRPGRLYRAGEPTDPINRYYTFRDDKCEGPFSTPTSLTYYELVERIDNASIPVFTDEDAGTGRLALRMRRSDDGLSVPLGVHDRELDLGCTPRERAGGFVCEPDTAAAAMYFADDACTAPVVLGEAAPIASVVDAGGCPRYHTLGAEVSSPIYRRTNNACVRQNGPLGQRAFALAAPISLPPLARAIEDLPEHRLQRAIFDDGEGLRFVGERLVDQATRLDCRRERMGDKLRCVPAETAEARTLFASGCTLPVRVTELPMTSCRTFAFAAAPDLENDAIDVFAIGDRLTTPLYHFAAGGCVAYLPPPGKALHALGPKLAPSTFLSAVTYGER